MTWRNYLLFAVRWIESVRCVDNDSRRPLAGDIQEEFLLFYTAFTLLLVQATRCEMNSGAFSVKNVRLLRGERVRVNLCIVLDLVSIPMPVVQW